MTMRKRLWTTVVVCSLLTGCAAMHPRTEHVAKQQRCEGGGACTVDVKVDCDRFYGCALSVDYDLVLVNGRGKVTDIVWHLSGETGARFTSNGIVIDSIEFEPCAPRADAREYVCSDKHSDFGIFKYRVNVTVPKSLFGPRGVPSLDPWIVND
jgi:hypothetical protein